MPPQPSIDGFIPSVSTTSWFGLRMSTQPQHDTYWQDWKFFFAFFSFDHKPSFSQPINQYISYRIWIETSCNSTSWFADGSNIVIIPQIELWLNSSYIDIGYSYRNWFQCSSSTSSNSYSLSFMIQPQHWLDSDRWLAGLNWAVWCEPLYKFNRAFNKKEEKTICLKIFA